MFKYLSFSFSQTLHCVCRIAEVLIKLQQAGHVKYIGWIIGFSCQTLLVEDLQTQAKKMENELDMWNKEVTLARERFYELNYYTTRQLLVLRSEFGRLKMLGHSFKQHQWGQVIALLESISSAITIISLANVVLEVANSPLEYLEDDDSLDPNIKCVGLEPSSKEASSATPCSTDQLASASVSNTKPVRRLHSLPHVGLSKIDLNDEQRAHFTDITEIFGYSEMTALKAIEAVDGGDWNDIENCLNENAAEWETTFVEAGTSEDESVEMEQDSEVEEDEEMESDYETGSHLLSKGIENTHVCFQYFMIVFFCLGADRAPIQCSGASPSSKTQSKFIVIHRRHIDENDKEVQELLDAGVLGSVEMCIKAIEVHGTASAAINHIMVLEEKKAELEENHDLTYPASQEHLTPVFIPYPSQTEYVIYFLSNFVHV